MEPFLDKHWDVLVVGAGPSGSSAARAAALKGLKVLLVERRRLVGVPVQCAEYVPAMLMAQIDVGKNSVIQTVGEMHTHLPGQDPRVMAAPGVIVARDRFDQTLADKAVAAGAVLITETWAKEMDGTATKVLIRCKSGRETWIHPRVIIGADGPRSRVRKWMGLAPPVLMPAVQMKCRLVCSLDYTQVFLDPCLFGGYGWVFPRGGEANVGLGVLPSKALRIPLKQLLGQFMFRLKKNGIILETTGQPTAGWLPVSPLTATVKNQMILAGDAASQTHPVTGAGIFPAVICGTMAGEQAWLAISGNDMKLLQQYEKKWRDFLGLSLDRGYRRKRMAEANWMAFHRIIRKGWIAFREYYEPIPAK